MAAPARLAPEVPVLSEESPWTVGDLATYWVGLDSAADVNTAITHGRIPIAWQRCRIN